MYHEDDGRERKKGKKIEREEEGGRERKKKIEDEIKKNQKKGEGN